jgi:adenylate kinase
MIREAIRSGAGPGATAKALVDEGQLLPDHVVLEIVEHRLQKEDCRDGFVLDGYPRNEVQAKDLDGVLERHGMPLDHVIELVLGEDVVVNRLTKRRTCTECGRVFHLEFNRPTVDGVCDGCHGALVLRDDDRESTIRKRLKVYRDSAKALAQYYDSRSLLRRLDAGQEVGEVARQVRGILEGER